LIDKHARYIPAATAPLLHPRLTTLHAQHSHSSAILAYSPLPPLSALTRSRTTCCGLPADPYRSALIPALSSHQQHENLHLRGDCSAARGYAFPDADVDSLRSRAAEGQRLPETLVSTSKRGRESGCATYIRLLVQRTVVPSAGVRHCIRSRRELSSPRGGPKEPASCQTRRSKQPSAV
jgi:hypothetical protein